MRAEVVTKKTITIEVGLDNEGMNVDMIWHADDAASIHNAKAMLLGFFDRESKDTMRIDIWTKDMMVMEMDRFVYYSLRGLADTYLKASANKELAEHMQKFAHYFGEKTEIIPRSE